MVLKNDWDLDIKNKVAVIGISCDLPGACNIDMLWNNLLQGKESIRQLTEEELITAGVEKEHLNNPNYVCAVACLEDYDTFDAAFFGYSSLDAKTMDPQQRKLLEQSYLCIEDAGYDYSRIEDRVGIFTGTAFNGYVYRTLLANKMDKEYLPVLIANDKDFASTRISYKLNFTGPSYNIQTACSTGLSALHLACQSILSDEIDMALIGTAAVKYPHNTGYFSMGTASKDGHVRTFDERASGTVFGSGVACMLLKRYEDALEDGDHIYATIIGSAVNNDGSMKAGYSGPSVDSQAEVIVEALANADLSAEKISYVETHGAGTILGDAVEISALTKAFDLFTERKQYCAIGSIKPNIGHADVCAGMSGLIKTVLLLNNKQFVPSINCENVNEQLDLERTPFYINKQQKKWECDVPRRAGVFATAIGGTNAFVVLEENMYKSELTHTNQPKLCILSAKTQEALEAAVDSLLKKLEETEDMNMDDVAYTLQVGRTKYDKRLYFVCKNQEEAISKLRNREVVYGHETRTCQKLKKTYWRFSSIEEVKSVYLYSKDFKEAFDACNRITKAHAQIDLWVPVESKLYESLLNFSVNYALAVLFKKVGIDFSLLFMKNADDDIVSICLKNQLTLEEAFHKVFEEETMINQTIECESTESYSFEEFVDEFMTLIGDSWLAGTEIQWFNIDQRKIRNRVSLPGYNFQKKRYLIAKE